ncbi:hypothetical protein J7E88_25035 [Streptomyces sp. ISL-10]|uniref:hypothetical protein n=1 Tax=Streptomyces sp. ISL-10 TaxID=2819172 RepID=UPI001BE95B40|nr:hypothetical protein [Streptomyces sp. ISL-10]MBT2368500.1 hypothetical protein [Streptomyces sp. ISL-10]
MNRTDPLPLPEAARATDHIRMWSVLAAVLFLPATLTAGVLTLASDRASRCLTYGEQCGTSLPGWLFGWGVGLGLAAWVVALAAPAVWVRRVAFAVQLLAECAALVVILSHA